MLFFDYLIDIFHSINLFLSTPGGELAKRSAEFILLFFMTYMAVSEYTRERTRGQLRYMIYGFGTLTIQRLMLMIAYAFIVFGELPLGNILPIILAFSEATEALGIVFVTGAFLYPLYLDRKRRFHNLMSKEVILVVVILLITEGIILFARGIIGLYFYLVTSYFYFLLFKLAVLAITLAILIRNNDVLDKYNPNVVQALLVYSITPLIILINVLFFNNSDYLRVLAHPFPFISVLLLLRVTYLKLADKGKLRHDLAMMRQRYLQEKELVKMKDDFISTVSHELRTPLTSMRLYLSLLKEGKFDPLTKKQKQTINLVSSETGRLTKLINDLLDLSRLDNQKTKIKKEEVHLNSLVDKTIPRNLAEEKNIDVINNIPKNLKTWIDKEKMQQVIINIFSNSLKYTYEGGRIIFDAVMDRGSLEITVTDTGKGIPKEKLSLIFGKFYQAEEHTTQDSKGFGLGLAIVNSIVKAHNGEVKVESEIGKGTKISIILPQAKE